MTSVKSARLEFARLGVSPKVVRLEITLPVGWALNANKYNAQSSHINDLEM